MKKEYISPNSFVYKVGMTAIMAGSLDPNKSGDQNVTLDPNEPAPDEFTSRRRSQWEDEEEDDY